jgi:ribosomal protein L13
MFKKLIVVDAKGHLLGRLASYIAKTLLSGTITIIQDSEL